MSRDAHDRDGDPPARTAPAVPVERYPGALDQTLLTPRAPRAPYPGWFAMGPAPRRQLSPPQWAADPSGRHQLRWWDGYDWSEHVADDGEAAVDPMA